MVTQTMDGISVTLALLATLTLDLNSFRANAFGQLISDLSSRSGLGSAYSKLGHLVIEIK